MEQRFPAIDSERKCFRCRDPNHFIGVYPKSSRSNNQKAFIGGAWSDSGKDKKEKAKDETCLVAQSSNEICLGINLEPDGWIKDSGCSKHMTGNRKLFSTYKAYNGGNVIFESNLRGNIIGKDFKLFQINVKSAFLNGFINVEVYVAKPPRFIDFAKPNHVYRLKKALYELKQAPKAWPDIMFSVFLCARFQENPKTSHLKAVKRIFEYVKGYMHLGLWYPKGSDIETIVYADSDHAGDYVDRKSTSGICAFMGFCLTSWFSKKQTALSFSTIEAEYVSVKKACQQALWMKQALIDLSKNPVQHSRTKHIEIRHHFLRDNVQKGNISIEKVSSEGNIADILTKYLKCEPFNYLRLGLGMMEQID
nr:copia protein [Tanacetum cinerariifolium]